MRRQFLIAAASLTALAACEKTQAPSAPGDKADKTEMAAAPEVEAAPADAPFDVSMTAPGVYKSDKSHAYITFSYDHQGYSRPWLRWRSWTGDLDWNPAEPEKSSISVVIDAASIDSGVDKFDGHLKSSDFFDVANYPEIRFKSSNVTIDGPAAAKVVGDLTINGVTKPATLDVRINRAADDDFAKGYKLGFSGKTVVKRSEFGVDKYVPFVGDEVEVIVEAEFVLPKETAPEL